MNTMDRKRKRLQVVDLSSFSREEIECAETLLSLSSSSYSSSSPPPLSSSPKSEKKQPTATATASASTNNKLRIVIRPPKPPAAIDSTTSHDSLPSIESMIDKFTPLDPCFGKKYIVVDKLLTRTDVNPSQTRLGILHSELNHKEEFLTQEEKDELEKTYSNSSKGHIRVKVRGCFSEKEHDMLMSKWYYDSGKGFKYALIGGWNSFKDQHGLQLDDKITVVAVRSQGVLCFAIYGGRRPRQESSRPVDLPLVPRHKRKRPAAAAAAAPCLVTWPRTLPRGAKGSDWKHVHQHKLISC